MAITTTGPSDIFQFMKQEFDYLGIRLDNVNIQHQANSIYSVYSSSPMVYSHGREIMTIEFTCSEEQFPYFKPLIHNAKSETITLVPPVHIYRDHYDPTRAPQPIQFEHKTIFRCSMQLSVTGGALEPFGTNFREATKELRYAVESKKFDDEIEKMLLEEDEYNK